MEPARLAALLALLGPALAAQGKPRQPSPARAAHSALRGTIAVGETVRDSLSRHDRLLAAEGTYAQEWRLAGRTGQTVTIDLSSDAFDAYAFLLGPGLERDQPQDDDSGGACNARLTVRLPETGDYYVVVTSSDKLATGAFVLTVTAGAKSKSLVPCNR
ncbi:MAG TPA: PPC domain-containing protein [Gemmatimonadales bacterium]|nr:PPC domain-containing protein [Gemmatimonadales bacterium]